MKAYNSKRRRNRTIALLSGAIILASVFIVCLVLVISGNNSKTDEEENSRESVIEINNTDVNLKIDTQESEELEETEATEEPEVVEASASEGSKTDTTDNADDPQVQIEVSATTGENVKLVDIKNASSAGENSNITYGIDVSRFQGTIDWAKVAASGIDFAMIRVGYRNSTTGEIKEDSNAKFNMQEATKYGIKIGAYFFSTAITTDEAIEEANFVSNIISKYQITYPVGYNCEGFEDSGSRQYSLSKDERSKIAKSFLYQVYSNGYTPMFYASKSELDGDLKWNTSDLESSFKMWVAWYGQNVNVASGPNYSGKCQMWQYTNNGNVDGISTKVDVDIAYFGFDSSQAAKSSEEAEIATADVEALMNFKDVDEKVTAKNNTNLRDKPRQGEDSNVMCVLTNGEEATRTGVSDSGWSRIRFNDGTYYAVSSFLTTDFSAKPQTEEKVTEETTEVKDMSGFKTKFTECNELVTAKEIVNLRSKPSVTDEDSSIIALLSSGEVITRTGINNEYGWSRVDYNGQTLYCVSSYLRTP